MSRNKDAFKWIGLLVLVSLVAWLCWIGMRREAPVAAPPPIQEGFQVDALTSIIGFLSTTADALDKYNALKDDITTYFPGSQCDTRFIGANKLWLCPTEDSAATVAESNKTDKTCFPDTLSRNVYYCNEPYLSDAEQAAAALGTTPPASQMILDRYATCRQIKKALYDLSGSTAGTRQLKTLIEASDQMLLTEINGLVRIQNTIINCTVGASYPLPTKDTSGNDLSGESLQKVKICNATQAMRTALEGYRVQLDAIKQLLGVQVPEVFQVSIGGRPNYSFTYEEAAPTCATYGATLATVAQLQTAQQHGADWCSSGWIADSRTAMYPITTTLMQGCGNGAPGIKTYTPGLKAAINCYGLKPPPRTADIMMFNQTDWYDMALNSNFVNGGNSSFAGMQAIVNSFQMFLKSFNCR